MKYSGNESELIVNLFSNECKLKMEKNGLEPKDFLFAINEIYSFIFKKESNYTLKPIKDYSRGESRFDYTKRTCLIIINSVRNGSNLTLEGKMPTFLFFNGQYQKFQLNYSSKNLNSFIAFSFLYHGKASFEIAIGNHSYVISSSTTIFAESENVTSFCPNNYCEINIKYINSNSTLLFLNVIKNNTISILENNYLNYGFITSKAKNQYYYMKIYDGEEGEIMLHNKRQNGKLNGLIVNKNDDEIKNLSINDFPDENNKTNNIEFDINTQKLSFKCIEDKCKNSSYLLITYILESYDKGNQTKEIGYEFTLLTRTWDNELNPQLINIPLNDYIFGSFREYSIESHYYFFLVPEDAKKIYIEFHGHFIDGFYTKGKKKIPTFKSIEGVYSLNLTINDLIKSIPINETEK